MIDILVLVAGCLSLAFIGVIGFYGLVHLKHKWFPMSEDRMKKYFHDLLDSVSVGREDVSKALSHLVVRGKLDPHIAGIIEDRIIHYLPVSGRWTKGHYEKATKTVVAVSYTHLTLPTILLV